MLTIYLCVHAQPPPGEPSVPWAYQAVFIRPVTDKKATIVGVNYIDSPFLFNNERFSLEVSTRKYRQVVPMK